jgi:hypothetical protein
MPNFWDGSQLTEIGEFAVDYVYLTDGTGTIEPTLINIGDEFLGWTAKDIRAFFCQHDDGSIRYLYIYVNFEGQAVINAEVVYWPNGLNGSEVIAIISEESLHLLPDDVAGKLYKRDYMIKLFGDEVDVLISERFSDLGRSLDKQSLGICRILIENFDLFFTYSEIINCADLVSICVNAAYE